MPDLSIGASSQQKKPKGKEKRKRKKKERKITSQLVPPLSAHEGTPPPLHRTRRSIALAHSKSVPPPLPNTAHASTSGATRRHTPRGPGRLLLLTPIYPSAALPGAYQCSVARPRGPWTGIRARESRPPAALSPGPTGSTRSTRSSSSERERGPKHCRTQWMLAKRMGNPPANPQADDGEEVSTTSREEPAVVGPNRHCAWGAGLPCPPWTRWPERRRTFARCVPPPPPPPPWPGVVANAASPSGSLDGPQAPRKPPQGQAGISVADIQANQLTARLSTLTSMSFRHRRRTADGGRGTGRRTADGLDTHARTHAHVQYVPKIVCRRGVRIYVCR